MRTMPMLVLGLPLLVLAAASCGGRSSPSGVAGASASRVTVEEQEYKLTLSTHTIAAGTTQFVVGNHGHLPHALEIDGPGVSDMRTPGTIMPGDLGTMHGYLLLTVTCSNPLEQCPNPTPNCNAFDVPTEMAACPCPYSVEKELRSTVNS